MAGTFPRITQVLSGGSGTVPLAASVAASTQLSKVPGVLFQVVVTTSAGGVVTLYDTVATSATGTILATTGLAAAQGTIYAFPNGQPVANGILAVSSASSPAVTITFS